MINVGIIGSGFIVPTFIETTKLVKGFKYVGISGRNETSLKDLKEKYNIGYYTLSNEKLLKDPSIDVIYLALPNSLHYPLAKQALLNNKHVIVEKPFTPSYAQAKQLIDLAKKKNKIIFDAVTMLHMPNYNKCKELINNIGDIKMIGLNFSQYSSRYGKFKKGIVLPAFDIKYAGGALMDLGIYNINFVTGLFDKPKKVAYFPNIYKNIDTSGVLVLDYGKFKVNSIIAKDCKAPLNVCIQGDLGYIKSNFASSTIPEIEHVDNKGKAKKYKLNKYPDIPHYHEYKALKELLIHNDLVKAQEFNKQTLLSIKVLDEALKSANIIFK